MELELIEPYNCYRCLVDRRWVLGGMEYVTGFEENAAEILSQTHRHFLKDMIPPEDTDAMQVVACYPLLISIY